MVKKEKGKANKVPASYRLPPALLRRLALCAAWKRWGIGVAAEVAFEDWCDKIEAERKAAGE